MNFSDIDFIQIYKEIRNSMTYFEKTSEDWDQMALRFHANHNDDKNPYTLKFLEFLNLEGVSTILDFGAGSGTLALPLAKRGYHVHALDFSSKMLEILNIQAESLNLNHQIQTTKKAWEDNWDEIEPTDLVIASRCISIDFVDAVKKLVSKAKKRVALSWLKSPGYINPLIVRAIGRTPSPFPDWIHVLNVLYQMGYEPQVRFIPWTGEPQKIPKKEEFLQSIIWKIGEISAEERKLAEEYYQNFVLSEPIKYGHGGFSWTFFIWEI